MNRTTKALWIASVFSVIIIASVAGIVVYFTNFRDSSDDPGLSTSETGGGGSASDSSASPSPSPSLAPTPSISIGAVPGSPVATATAVASPDVSVPSVQPTESGKAVFDHLAHAVPGFQTRVVDYDGDGVQEVQLDGSLSHTHYVDEGPPIQEGYLRYMKWFRKSDGEELSRETRPLIEFSVGVTEVGLTVEDNSGDVNTAFTEIIVEKPIYDGAYCYFYKASNSPQITISLDVDDGDRPTFGKRFDGIDFADASAFPENSKMPSGNFQVRCTVIVTGPTSRAMSVDHFGPLRMVLDDTVVLQSDAQSETSSSVTLDIPSGDHIMQLQYARASSSAAKLVVTEDGDGFQYDASKVLPVLFSIEPFTSTLEGGGLVKITGVNLENNIKIDFGGKMTKVDEERSSNTALFLIAPSSSDDTIVDVRAVNNAGTSNALRFEYKADGSPPIKFTEERVLQKEDGSVLAKRFVTGIKYGPDHRYYMSATDNVVHSFAAGADMRAHDLCTSSKIGDRRAILGLAFNPADTKFRLFVSASVLHFQIKDKLSGPFAWANGRIYELRKNINGECLAALDDPVIDGLPVSNHDHGVNGLEFDNDGKLRIQVGGFTNAGVNDFEARLGGFAENPLSGASLVADINHPSFNGKITYDVDDPPKARQTGGDVSVFSSGWRNSFSIAIHSNGFLYATDNGASIAFGDRSTSCTTQETLENNNLEDELNKVLEGRYCGHPNRNRGRFDEEQCKFQGPYVKSKGNYLGPVTTFESSTDGIVEYTANTFQGQLKGDLLCSKYSTADSPGKLFRVQLNGEGELKSGPDEMWKSSGLSLVMSPWGDLLMPRVYKNEIIMLRPQRKEGLSPEFTAVTPFRGPLAGGNEVLITGEQFAEGASATFDGAPCTSTKPVTADGRSFMCVVPPAPGSKRAVQVGITFSDSSLNIAASSTGVDYRYMDV